MYYVPIHEMGRKYPKFQMLQSSCITNSRFTDIYTYVLKTEGYITIEKTTTILILINNV